MKLGYHVGPDGHKEAFDARMRTLEQLRAHVDADSRVHIRFDVRCGRVLRGWRPIPKTLTG